MPKPKKHLNHENLLSLLHYDPLTGVFTWRVRRNSYGGGVEPGSVAGQIHPSGHRMIGIEGRLYQAHRLAWFYMNGVWPSAEIDHSDMIADNNKFDNLREATKTLQRANQRVRRDSRSGLKGVRPTKGGRWQARISANGVKLHLGNFDTPEQAQDAYISKAKELFGDFARAA